MGHLEPECVLATCNNCGFSERFIPLDGKKSEEVADEMQENAGKHGK
jgi:hypothetical protein